MVGSLAMLVSCSSTTSSSPAGNVVVPESTTQSYIVEGRTTDLAARAVTAAGGEVGARLEIIDAVEARLTDTQHAIVLADAGIKQVSANALVTTQAAANVRDNFETGSLANNNGTHRWYGNWIEQNDDNNPHGGKMMIGWNDRGGNRLIATLNGAIYRRAATPASASAVTLRFKALRAGLEMGEFVSVQASSNGGGSWTELGRLSGPATDSVFASKSFDLTRFRGRNTAVRFVASMSGRYGDDHVAIDDVEIAYNTTFGEGDPLPVEVNAHELHQAGNKGGGITVAVIDTGFWKLDSLDKDSNGSNRVDFQFDAVRNVVDAQYSSVSTDSSGHGSHITSLIASSRRNASGRFFGVAPDVRLVSIKAFGEDGSGSYATVIRGIDWVVNNRQQYNIKVLNLSLGAPARSRYWDDPLNKAVMRAWQSGIVVVVSAGNSGPLPQTVGVPGNVPYVITVGAMTDNYTSNAYDDRLALFSSAGPTYEGFVKPDVVAPGGHVWGFMATYQKIAADHPTYMNNGDFFTMSGTSQAAAVVSGVAALVVASNHGLTPDQVKCRILASAKPALNADGTLAYSLLQQGMGLVNAKLAVQGTASNCANQGLNIGADLAGTQHFSGGVIQQADGTFEVTLPDGFMWPTGKLWQQGKLWPAAKLWPLGSVFEQSFLWPMGKLWPNSFLWTQGQPYSGDIPWVDGYPSPIDGAVGSTSAMSINAWVAQE